ncbi:MAG: hypothetical protein WC208_00230 [Gallionella sp.]|jgi:hypothetical protein
MKPIFVWDNNPPDSMSKERIESNLASALELANTRNLEPAKLELHLSLDKSQTRIDAIGYDQTRKPLFICDCAPVGEGAAYYCYYYGEEDHRKSQFANLQYP